MLSRIADSLFWMNRYVERADGLLRMLKINFITSLDRTGETAFNWQPVLEIFTDLDKDALNDFKLNSDEILLYMITNRENPNSIRNIIARARENARGVQDHITKEVWECINEFYHAVNSPDIDDRIKHDEQIVMLSELINHCLIYYGVSEITMPRAQGWQYMNMGRYIERAVITVDILDTRFSQLSYDLNNTSDIPYWRNFLLSLSGYELYLKQYRSGLESHNVADLAILNTEFPRSVLYCLNRLVLINESLESDRDANAVRLDKLIGRLKAKVEFSDIESISKQGLHNFLKGIKEDLYGFGNALARTYFAYQ